VNNNCSKKVLGGTAAQSIIRGLLIALVAPAVSEASKSRIAMDQWQPGSVSERTGNHSLTCADLMTMAERELSAFIRAVTELFGSEQARLSAEDWLDELASMDCLPGSTSRDWRAVTIAALARLAKSGERLEAEDTLAKDAETQGALDV
jgi:hypothetical protein